MIIANRCVGEDLLNFEGIYISRNRNENLCLKQLEFPSSDPGISNAAAGDLLSCRFQLQPQLSKPEPANQGVRGHLIITGRCVGSGLELKSAGQ